MGPHTSHRRSDNRQARQAGAVVPATRVWAYAALVFMLFTVAAPLGLAWAQTATAGPATEYRDILTAVVGSRNLIWVISHEHHHLAGLRIEVPILYCLREIVGV